MQLRTILIGAFALVFGIAAAIGAYLLVQSPAAASKPETVSVVVAAVDINRGETLSAEHLVQREWPKDAVPEGVVLHMKDAVDRTARIALLKGDLLSEGKLAPAGAGRGMAAIIPDGMRAVTIQTPNVASGVAGFILPGNKVDVLLTVSSSGTNDPTGGGSTITLLQNVEILAVDQRIDAPQDNKMDLKELRSVTLLVNPDGAARLDLGQNKGTLRLALRSHADKGTTFVQPATLAGLRINPLEPITVLPQVLEQVVSEKSKPVAPPRPVLIRTLHGAAPGFVQLPSSIHHDAEVTPAAATLEAHHARPIDPSAAISGHP
ncbi:MAG TPA: Flp pilus assembly protein CpaB [Pirellulaceae bacterium]|nr:Flp pilus assembly protein CpaB [Pirellulaceae bacterium]